MSTEDRWTPASGWCAHPEWWHCDPSNPDVTEYEVTALALAFVRALQPEIVVETGTSTGATAEAIGTALAKNGHGHLWTVEVDEEVARRAADRLHGLLPVTVVAGDSLAWTPPSPIDFAWIDSGPGPHRVQEVFRWREKFSSGAVIGMHDTAPNQGREVHKQHAEAAFSQLGWQHLNLRTPRGVIFVQVP